MTEADLNSALDRLARSKDVRLSGSMRARIDARIREVRNNYVKLPYAAAILIALGVLGFLQLHRARQQAMAQQEQELNVDYLLPSNMLYHEQE